MSVESGMGSIRKSARMYSVSNGAAIVKNEVALVISLNILRGIACRVGALSRLESSLKQALLKHHPAVT